MGPRRMTLSSGEVRWEIRYNDAGRGSPYRRRRFDRKEDAQTFLDEMRRRRRLGELAESEWARRTVRALALDWWAFYVVPNLSPRTRRDYKKLLVAPVTMKERFLQKIEREAEHAKAGRPARIIEK